MRRSEASRRTHRNSPIQPGRDRPGLIFATAAVAAIVFWSIQQSDVLDEPGRAAATDSEPGAASGSPSRAKGNLTAYFSGNDYPAEAIRREETGTVAFKLQIDTRGRVSDCAIEKSSGSASLDRATCTIIRRRARYQPARDPKGRAVPDVATGRIRWVLPEY